MNWVEHTLTDFYFSDGVGYIDYVNVMAYDYYWTGYDFTLDLVALNELGYKNVTIKTPFLFVDG